MTECACGCGKPLPPASRPDRVARYLRGHNPDRRGYMVNVDVARVNRVVCELGIVKEHLSARDRKRLERIRRTGACQYRTLDEFTVRVLGEHPAMFVEEPVA